MIDDAAAHLPEFRDVLGFAVRAGLLQRLDDAHRAQSIVAQLPADVALVQREQRLGVVGGTSRYRLDAGAETKAQRGGHPER